jgi:hypothetical protein
MLRVFTNSSTVNLSLSSGPVKSSRTTTVRHAQLSGTVNLPRDQSQRHDDWETFKVGVHRAHFIGALCDFYHEPFTTPFTRSLLPDAFYQALFTGCLLPSAFYQARLLLVPFTKRAF